MIKCRLCCRIIVNAGDNSVVDARFCRWCKPVYDDEVEKRNLDDIKATVEYLKSERKKKLRS